MADISKCKGENCKLKTKCKRYLEKEWEYQSWIEEEFKNGKCVNFWEIKKAGTKPAYLSTFKT